MPIPTIVAQPKRESSLLYSERFFLPAQHLKPRQTPCAIYAYNAITLQPTKQRCRIFPFTKKQAFHLQDIRIQSRLIGYYLRFVTAKRIRTKFIFPFPQPFVPFKQFTLIAPRQSPTICYILLIGASRQNQKR